ncbi:MAG: rhomboid family intramembrane serine protease [Lachnospiraceae bacterium]|nr:rhomboid family intramembrane serine protease [Lachnospiraceae bacterium]
MWDKLQQYFTGRGLREADLRKETMRLYYHAEKTSADAVWMINDEALADLTKEKYGNYLATIRGIFEKQGFSAVSVLTLFVSGQIAACKEIGEGNAFWIVDETYGRLVVYENQPEDYLGIRSVIENNLRFGGHSRNADGVQIDLSHDNLRSESRVTPISRASAHAVAEGSRQSYTAELARRKRLQRSQRTGRFRGMCVVTIVLVLVNVVIFLLTDFFQMENLLVRGELNWHTAFEEKEYYRLFTCMFLHYGIDHIGGNMIALYSFGDIVERNMSRVRYAILYLAAGLGSSVVSCLFYHYIAGSDPFSVGASGAIYGLMGAFLMLVLTHPEVRNSGYGRRVGIFVIYLVYTTVLTMKSGANINVAAHTGGFVCGSILFLILDRVVPKKKKNWSRKLRG